MNLIFLLLLFQDIHMSEYILTGFHSTLGHLKAQTSSQVQAQAAAKVIERLIPDKATLFQVTVDPKLGPVGKDTFKVP
jgi:hypothetical protein